MSDGFVHILAFYKFPYIYWAYITAYYAYFLIYDYFEVILMKSAIYCRVSTEEQATGGHSIEAQRQELIKYCEAFNYEIHDFYIDAGYSASTMARPALQNLLKDANEYDVALVWRMDRISRDMTDLMKILEVFSNYRVAFKSKTENFDTSTASGKLMLNMLGSFAEFERASISERIKMAHKKILKEGKWRGGRPPLGYNISEDKILVINEDEAAVIRKIFDLSAYKNVGSRTIAVELNNLGYTTRSKKPFTSSYITRILKNPTYCGEMIHGRQQTVKKNGKKKVVYNDNFNTYSGLFEPIVTKQTFDRSLYNMEKRKLNRGTSNTIPNILAGLIYCGDCKQPLLRNKRRNGNAFFMCKGYKDLGICTHHYIAENVVIKEIKKATIKLEEDKSELINMNKRLINEKEKEKVQIISEIEHLQQQVSTYESREDKLFELIEKELITDSEFIDRKRKLTQEKSSKLTLLQQLQDKLEVIDNIKGNKYFIKDIETFNKQFDKKPPEQQKEILNRIIQRIEIFNNERPYAKKKVHVYFKI